MATARGPLSRHLLLSGTAATILAACIPALALAADLNGHWHSNAGYLVTIEQTTDAIQLTKPGGAGVYTGTISGSSVELTSTNPQIPESWSLTLAPDEASLAGPFHTIACVLSYCTGITQNQVLSRCECWDGNADNGDGCDVECRVEGCFSCTAEPSTCTPVADTTPCEDPSDCVSGGSCSAGTCDGGLQAQGCFDIGGKWQASTFYYEAGYRRASIQQVLQAQGQLSVYSEGETTLEGLGTLDTSTGVLSIGDGGAWPYCGLSGLDAQVATDGNSYTGERWSAASTPRACINLELVGEVGLRCAAAGTPTADGCAADSCMQCSGDPQVCVPVADQTACHSDDPCTVVASCQRGQCVASVSDTCPVCTTCDGAGGCTSAPRANCRRVDEPSSTALSIRSTHGGAKGSFRWDWSGGDAIRTYDLGRPELYSDVALCVFDESTSTPSLVTKRSVDYEYSGFSYLDPAISPGWSIDAAGSASYRDGKGYSDGIKSIRLVQGSASASSVRIRGKGVGLPAAPFALPLRAQLQIQGGACFEGTYGEAGVRRNANGSFRAVGTR